MTSNMPESISPWTSDREIDNCDDHQKWEGLHLCGRSRHLADQAPALNTISLSHNIFKYLCLMDAKDNRSLLQKLLSFRYQKPNQIPIEGTVSNPEFEPNQISEPEPDENRSSFDHGEVD